MAKQNEGTKQKEKERIKNLSTPNQITKAKTNEKAESKNKQQQPATQWKQVFKNAWHDFSPRYLSNLIFLAIGLLVAPAVGVFMNKPKLTIGGFALGLTILIWVFAYHLIKRAEPDNAIPAIKGYLMPANDPSPPNPCNNLLQYVKDPMTIYFAGQSAAFTSRDYQSLIRIGAEDVLTMRRTPSGILINAIIRDARNQEVVSIKDNVFQVTQPDGYFCERPDPYTINIIDPDNKVLFSLRYLNPRAIKISGIFRKAGHKTLTLQDGASNNTGMCIGETFEDGSCLAVP